LFLLSKIQIPNRKTFLFNALEFGFWDLGLYRALADNFLPFNDYFLSFIKIISDIFSNSIFLLCELRLSRLSLIRKPDFDKKFLILTL